MMESFGSEAEGHTEYGIRTYHVGQVMHEMRHHDWKHQFAVARFMGKNVRDLNYEDDYVLVGTFVPEDAHIDKRNLPEYHVWRAAVFQRDVYTCQRGGSKKELQAHHKKQVALYPELIFDVENGEVLCKSCHREVPVYRSAQDRR